MLTVNTIEQWRETAELLSAGGYTIWQMQYDTQHPEGFHARFWASKKPEIEVVTRNDKVHDEIVKYKPK